jgi:hydroxyacylglutathione hydrolase
MQVHYLKIFDTNYVWILQHGSDIIIIDPGEDKIITNYITENRLNLVAVLLTHGHMDHIGGLNSLLKSFNVPVYGNISCELIDEVFSQNLFNVNNNSSLNIWTDIVIKTLLTPGHTLDGVSYIVESDNQQNHLFCGDTLFGAGCGRVFTNDYDLMLKSLNEICKLDDEIKIYPAHEYTLDNLTFAEFIEPDNLDIKNRVYEEKSKLLKFGVTLPTSLELEKRTNPFLRANMLSDNIKSITGIMPNDELECFRILRQLKDDFVAK